MKIRGYDLFTGSTTYKVTREGGVRGSFFFFFSTTISCSTEYVNKL